MAGEKWTLMESSLSRYIKKEVESNNTANSLVESADTDEIEQQAHTINEVNNMGMYYPSNVGL